MKNHAKRAIKHLEAIGFGLDESASNPRKGKWVYRHPNDPSRPVKVFAGESDTTSTSVMRLGDKIAETGATGPTMPSNIRERARIGKAKSKAERERDQRARDARAEAAEAEHQRRLLATQGDQRRGEIEGLMRPGNGR